MRSLVLALLLPLACYGCGARRQQTHAPEDREAVAIRPAPTPAEAFERAMRAMAAGDEAAYRRIVVFAPPSRVAEAQARERFASARLHRAVGEHGVTGRRVCGAGFDKSRTLLPPAPPSRERVEQAMEAYRRIEWKVDGDVATPSTTRPVFGPEKQIRIERLGNGWVVIVSDSNSLPDSEPGIRQYAQSSTVHAEIYDSAAAQVRAGKLRTVREVNDFIEGRKEAIARVAMDALKVAPPGGPVVVVTDAETGKPVAGAIVSARVIAPPGTYQPVSATTDAQGRARLPAEPDTIHHITVEIEGYARRDQRLNTVPAEGGRPEEVHLTIGKPAIVDVMLVLPDERRAAVSVHEGDEGEAAEPGVREKLEPKRIRMPVQWADEPPNLPEHHPLLRLQFTTSPHHGKKGIVHRVTHAQTAAGRELPVFRDAPPPDAQTFGLYDIGRNGLGDTVFVIGTLNDARAAEASASKLQWRRNTRVLGPVARPATRPS